MTWGGVVPRPPGFFCSHGGARGAGVVVGGAAELVVGKKKKKSKHCLAEALGDKIG